MVKNIKKKFFLELKLSAFCSVHCDCCLSDHQYDPLKIEKKKKPRHHIIGNLLQKKHKVSGVSKIGQNTFSAIANTKQDIYFYSQIYSQNKY